jgi:hypothetical protein
MNYKILLLALVAFSFLLAGCGGKKAGETAPVQAPAEETGGSEGEETTPEDVEDVETEEEIEGAPPEEAEKLADLFDIEINEPPEDYTYDKAPGEE